jgi:protein TonB
MVLAGLAAASFWAVRQGYLPIPALNPSATLETKKTSPLEAPEPPSFGLSAEKSGWGVKITWIRNASAVLAAVSGTLSVVDGQAERTLQLSPENLRTGSVILQPRSQRLDIKLSLLLNNQTVNSETVFLLLDPGTPTLQVIHPQQRDARNSANGPVPSPVPASPVLQTHQADTPQRSGPSVGAGTAAEQVADPPPQLKVDPPPAAAVAASNSALQSVPTEVQAPAPVEPAKPKPEVSHTPASQTAPVPSPRVLTPPKPIHQQKVALTPLLRSMIAREVSVPVRVTIDENGRVVDAKAARTPSVNPYVSGTAEIAARQWRYKPATIDGRPVRSESIIEFQFRP